MYSYPNVISICTHYRAIHCLGYHLAEGLEPMLYPLSGRKNETLMTTSSVSVALRAINLDSHFSIGRVIKCSTKLTICNFLIGVSQS